MPDLDLIGAIVSKAQAATAITSLTSTRISGERQPGWSLPANALWIDGPKGGPVIGSPLRRSRVDFHCYGTRGINSKLLAMRVLQVFVPDDGAENGFTAAHTVVCEVAKEAEPFYLPDPDAGWPHTLVPLLFTYQGVPV